MQHRILKINKKQKGPDMAQVVKCCLAITRLMSLTPIPQKRKKECERNQ
jgi:hypothetical protein